MSRSLRKLRVALLLSILFATLGNATAQTSSAVTDLSDYINDLRHWSAGLTELPSHPEKAPELRRSIPLKMEVKAGNQHFAISNSWLVLGLVHWENDARQRTTIQQQVAQRLQWELQQAEELSRPSESPSPQVARAQLAAVLSGREFRFVRPPSWWDLMWARVWRWIGRQLEKLMRRLHLKPAISNVVSWILLGAAFLLLALVLWQNLRRAGRDMTSLGLAAPDSSAWGWRQWIDAARTAMAEQRHREAVHCCYWAAVFRLEQMGVWRVDPSRTPREYLHLLPRDSQHRQAMVSLTQIFETVWYGYRSVTPAQAESALQKLENLGCSSPSIAATASC